MPAGSVKNQKTPPGHPVGTGQKRRERAQHGDELAEEHDLAAMLQKEVLAQLYAALGDSDVAAVAEQEGIAKLAADPEANVISDDCASGRRDDHPGDAQPMRRARVDRGSQQCRLAREGNNDAFDAVGQRDRALPVLANQVRYIGRQQRHISLRWHEKAFQPI